LDGQEGTMGEDLKDDIAAVFHGGPFAGRVDTIPFTPQPRYFDTVDGGWALYALTPEVDGGRRVLRYQHGSDDAA
jgi:hypothetical protein